MKKWRIWHSAKSFAQFIVNNTLLSESTAEIEFRELAESDAAKGIVFSKVPDHIKKILYLDAPDVIIEYNSEPILTIEETKEAGTGHNTFQRFARIAASVESGVPAIYILPEAKIITRRTKQNGTTCKWDIINPLIFHAFDSIIKIFDIPALIFFYPSTYHNISPNTTTPCNNSKGLLFNPDIINYPACPAINGEMQQMFETINVILQNAISGNTALNLRKNRIIMQRWDWMAKQFHKRATKPIDDLSPLTATHKIPTDSLLSFLSQFSKTPKNSISELLSSRKQSIVYACDAAFRGDPYPGALAAIDYMKCRTGKTYEDRDTNLVLCFGELSLDQLNGLHVTSGKCTVNDFISSVEKSGVKNLLTAKSFAKIQPLDIGRYYMQVRYGSTYSKAKHIRVYSYFADAIIFKDGALWREA